MGLVNWAEGHERIALSNFDKAIACGDNLQHALFPKLYPCSDPAERAEAAAGRCTRS